ncbi:acyl-CoA dehydratase activase [Sporolactobacillus sp. KGMB 08714]|uniref:acyl-CoA dehydratase activase n=1 Tax=Sporolactobacillus sp. KGMB 08714 TaxID=3064704 RepID=UPI002FBD5198
MYTLGIDIGSTATKGVILEDGRSIVRKALAPVGAGTSGPSRVMQALFQDAEPPLTENDISGSVVTGYGRMTFKKADHQISELSCHAKGVFFLLPAARTIIDIGGQDAKVLKLSSEGDLLNFVMNDKCAAGTGRFLDVMAGVLEVKVEDLGKLAHQSERPSVISSTCTVFAESEVISRLAHGEKKTDVIAGISRSIARRISGLVFRAGVEEDVIMTGGVACNSGVVRMMEDVLKVPIILPEIPQFTGALGAALYAYERIKNKNEGCVKSGDGRE